MSDTIKEYLVALGFKVDEAGLKRFDGALTKTERTATKFALTSIAAGATVERMVSKIADRYTDLYYASERMGASVQNIDAFVFASRQIGVSADAAAGAVESFTSAMRLNPGIAGFASKLIGTDATKLDGVEAYLRVVERLKRQFGTEGPGFAVGARYGSLLGIDPTTLRQDMLHLDELKRKYNDEKSRQNAMGIDAKKAADEARNYTNALALLDKRLGDIALKFSQVWLPRFEKFVDDLEIGVDWIVKADKATDGWSTNIGIIVGALGGWASAALALRSTLGLLGITAGETTAAVAAATSAGAATAAGEAGVIASLGGRIPAVAIGAAAVAAGAGAVAIAENDQKTPFGRAANRFARYNIWQNDIIPFAHRVANTVLGRQTYKQSKSDVEKLMAEGGRTREQATGIVANEIRESGGNDKAVGDNGQAYGEFQWHKDRQDAFREWSGKDIKDSTHDEQLSFANYELTKGKERAAGDKLRETKTPEAAAQVVSHYYERPKYDETEQYDRAGIAQDLYAQMHTPDTLGAAIRGSGQASSLEEAISRARTADLKLHGVTAPPAATTGGGSAAPSITMNNKTDVHVVGSSDPVKTGNAVAATQDRVNNNASRNLSGLIQ